MQNQGKKGIILLILCIGAFLCMLDTTIMTITIPKIQDAFNIGLNQVSWAINLYTIVFSSITLLMARIAEIYGKNRFMLLGFTLFGVGSLVSGLSTTLLILFIGRIVQSIGAALILPLASIIGLSSVSIDKRNKIVALIGGVSGLAAAIGPTIGGLVTEYLGWRWVFFINVPLIVIVIIVFLIALPLEKSKEQGIKSQKFDFFGAILSIVMMFSFTLALIKGKDWGWNSFSIVSLLFLSLISLILFIFNERKFSYPMIDTKLFSSHNFVGAALILLFCNFLLGGFVILIPTYLVKIEGLTELQAALMILPYSITVLIATVGSSLLMKKINSKFLLLFGFIFIFSSYVLLGKLYTDWQEKLTYASILLGIGYGIIAGPSVVIAASDFTGKQLTTSQSVTNVLRQVGLVISIAICMSLLSSNMITARTNITNYADSKIDRSDLPNNIKSKMKHKINSNVEASASQNSSNKLNQNTINLNKIKVTKAQRDSIIENNLVNLLAKKGVSLDKMPIGQQKLLRQQIAKKVNKEIDHKEIIIKKTISQLIRKIHRISIHEIKSAFLNIYVTISYFIILGLIPIVFLKKQKSSN
ncbi:MFS transporter [Bombilactobacillus bombi]|uniref:MFS transporter n=1 Tax=Bombilactobacillus bombi TaxID=1303590 RepID=UPI0015E61047|nr:MFS transporter [Bombilactobacillus bombi]MBA1433898.1 MFS transporter [Bombilactobacillus bombi]